LTLTTFDNQPVSKPFAWSFSALDSYETCAKKFYHARVKKDFPEPENDDMKWGFRVHDALAKRIMHASPLPNGMKQWEKWVDWAMQNTDRTNTIIQCERKLAITEQMQPCEYFDKRVNPWFRTVADVLKVRANVARLIDWKTGKVKEDSDQLNLTAAALMAHYPEVEHVLCQFVWLAADLKEEALFSRADLPRLWTRMMPKVDKLRTSYATGEWLPRPSGLCKKHCSVISCAYHKRGAY
jgi:hypothetical protein